MSGLHSSKKSNIYSVSIESYHKIFWWSSLLNKYLQSGELESDNKKVNVLQFTVGGYMASLLRCEFCRQTLKWKPFVRVHANWFITATRYKHFNLRVTYWRGTTCRSVKTNTYSIFSPPPPHKFVQSWQKYIDIIKFETWKTQAYITFFRNTFFSSFQWQKICQMYKMSTNGTINIVCIL